jgi:hypothetical protein
MVSWVLAEKHHDVRQYCIVFESCLAKSLAEEIIMRFFVKNKFAVVTVWRWNFNVSHVNVLQTVLDIMHSSKANNNPLVLLVQEDDINCFTFFTITHDYNLNIWEACFVLIL